MQPSENRLAIVMAHKGRPEHAAAARAHVERIDWPCILIENAEPEYDWCRGMAYNEAIDVAMGRDDWDILLTLDGDIVCHPTTGRQVAELVAEHGAGLLGTMCLGSLYAAQDLGLHQASDIWNVRVTAESAILNARCQYTGLLALRRDVVDKMLAAHRQAGIAGMLPEYGTWGGDDTLAFESAKMATGHEALPYALDCTRHIWHPPAPSKPAFGTKGDERYETMKQQLKTDLELLKAIYGRV